jgi:hypothetical protein
MRPWPRKKNGAVECVLTHKEVAEIMRERGHDVTAKSVWHLEWSALRKMAMDPLLRQLVEDAGLLAGEEPEDD